MHQTMNDQKYTLTLTNSRQTHTASGRNNGCLHYCRIKQFTESPRCTIGRFPSFVCALFAHQDSDRRPSALELSSFKIRAPPTIPLLPVEDMTYVCAHAASAKYMESHLRAAQRMNHRFVPLALNPSRRADVLFPAALAVCT